MNAYASEPPKITRFLASGERIVWSGHPPAGLRLRKQDAFLVPFSILWGGFACMWEFSVLTTHAPFFFKLFGIPFVLVGLYVMFGRFFVDAYLRARTTYAVTDRAAYVVRSAPLAAVRRYSGSALDLVTFEPATDGRGTVRFAAPIAAGFSNRNNIEMWNGATLDVFEDIPNVVGVYRDVVAIHVHETARKRDAT